jgi:biopolymer transport protein ExbB
MNSMKRILIAAMPAMILAGSVSAQTFDKVSAGAREDLAAALKELSELQDKIGEEKIPLSRKMNTAEEAVLAKKKELENREREQGNQLVDLNALKTQVSGRSNQVAYLTGLFNEFSQAIESRLHVTETVRFEKQLQAIRAVSENQDVPEAESLSQQAESISLALGRVEALLGGEIFEGEAIVDGTKQAGSFALFGPVAIFSSGSGSAGVAQLERGTADPVVKSAAPEQVAGIRAVIQAGNGQFPIDTSMGDADKIAATEETMMEHMVKGGPTMVPIVGLGALAVLIGILKYFQIGFVRLARPRDIQIIVERVNGGDMKGASEQAKRVGGPVGNMLKVAIEHATEKKEYIEEVLYEVMIKVRPRIESFLPVVAIAAATAPLLGLLGTVTGMINTFKIISVFGTGDPKMLSSGISEALITTEFGLITAIPALLIHAVISRKVKGVLGAMEQISVAFINGLDPSLADPREDEATRDPIPVEADEDGGATVSA